MNRRLAVVALVVPLALALTGGCGPDGSGSLGTLPTGGPATSPSPEPAGGLSTTPAPGQPSPADPALPGGDNGTGAPSRTLTIEVWFTRDGRLFHTTRTRPHTPATARLALTELAAGPSAAEASAGVGNGVPADLTWSVSVADGVATLDLPASFYAGGREAARLRQAQVVYTLTQFPTVSTVGFQAGGEPAGWPVGREDYADLLPPIVVTSPLVGQRVTSPVRVAGTADVFEATVSVRILDAAGAEIATTFTTASCGTGCRGDYTIGVPYRSATEQRGTIQVYEVSAEDGSRTNVVDIPVTLAPNP